MARLVDAVVVVDVEATCWDGKPPPGEHNEIIEIGACLLDVATLTRSDKRGWFVRPERSTVSPFCTELTTIRPENVANAPTLFEVLAQMQDELDAKNRPWASYGDYDRRQFEKDCKAKSVRYPFGPAHLNVKNLAAFALGHTRPMGMAGALKELGIPLEGTHHRGVDDAWNIAAVLAAVLKAARSGLTSRTS